MQGWSYRVLTILTLICAACSSRPDHPSARVNSNSAPTAVGVPAKSPQNKPSPSTQLVADQTSKNEGGVRLPEIDPLEVEGNLKAVGSSTVFHISKVIYERFIKSGYAGVIELSSTSTGSGFKLFCKGKADITSASRPIKVEETQACAAIGRTPIEFRIGIDAAIVVVNPKNTFATNVSKKELAALFSAEKWSDVNPNWPKEKIQRFPHVPGSGSFDLLVEKAFNGKSQPLMNAPNTEFTEDNGYITQSVAANPYAISAVPYLTYKKDADTLKAISIEGVEPSAETARSGKYLLTRSLLLYSDANIIRKKPQVKAFLNFYLTHVNQEIGKVGYFSVTPKTLDDSKAQLLKVMESQDTKIQ